jgi:uncharacterized protein
MDALNQKYILSYLREHKDFLESEFGVTKIALFGSFARNEEHPDSDIDLLMESTSPTFTNQCLLKEHLETVFGRSVDVTYFDGVRSFYREYIDKDLIYA